MATFNYVNETEVVIPDQAKYLYHFINHGETLTIESLGIISHGHIDCHHLVSAIVSADSFEQAVEMLSLEEWSVAGTNCQYEVDVYLAGVDLNPRRDNPILVTEHQSPIG